MRYIACLLLLLLTFTFKVHAEGTYYILNTDDSLDGSADALNYSQGNVLTIDKFNKFIIITQGRVGPVHHFAWSNDNGTTWTEGSEEYSFLTRGSIAYDENNDKLHVIWTASDANDGIIYRRYGITRDGSNNITAISREDSGNINLQLDTSSIGGTLPQPVAIWHDDGTANGILIAIWGKYGAGLAEIRASMRNLSLSAADGNGANWKALDNVADTFSVEAPLVAADKIYGANSGSAYASAILKNNDLYTFVASTNTTGGAIIRAYKADFATNDWSGVWTGPINMGSFDNTSGYSLKGELITKPVLDTTNDRIYIGWPTWKDGTDGDTVRFSYLDSADTPSAVYNVYSALGTHSYAPTLDLAYDEDQDLVYISYVESTTNGSNGSIKYKTFDGTSLSSENTFYTNNTGSAGEDGSADIPVMYKSRYDNKLLFFLG